MCKQQRELSQGNMNAFTLKHYGIHRKRKDQVKHHLILLLSILLHAN